MGRRILLIQGHPDSSRPHLCHALADAYAAGAAEGGHDSRTVDVGRLDFPVLRTVDDWQHGSVPPALADAQASIAWCEHLVVLFPLWLGDMPALLKAFLEQVARPGFAFDPAAANPFAARKLRGRSARVVVTMGMPALVYRHFYRAHSVRSLERNILGFVGFSPVRQTLIGGVGQVDAGRAASLTADLRRLGRNAA